MDLGLLPCRVPLGDARPSDKGSMGKQFGALLVRISPSKRVTSRSAGLQGLRRFFPASASGCRRCTAKK